MVFVYWMRLEKTGEKGERKVQHEAGLSLLSDALEEQYGISRERGLPKLEYGIHGKPFLKELSWIHFNISHCAGLAVCGVGSVKLGVDVELIRPYHSLLPKKALSAEEQIRLAGEREELRPELFCRLWTLKESYLKAEGSGITVPLTTVSFRLSQDGAVVFENPEWKFWQQKLTGGSILSVCAKGEGAEPRLIERPSIG